jgi:hypothetical protein
MAHSLSNSSILFVWMNSKTKTKFQPIMTFVFCFFYFHLCELGFLFPYFALNTILTCVCLIFASFALNGGLYWNLIVDPNQTSPIWTNRMAWISQIGPKDFSLRPTQASPHPTWHKSGAKLGAGPRELGQDLRWPNFSICTWLPQVHFNHLESGLHLGSRTLYLETRLWIQIVKNGGPIVDPSTNQLDWVSIGLGPNVKSPQEEEKEKNDGLV